MSAAIRRRLALLSSFLAACATLPLAGCGGGSASPAPPPAAPCGSLRIASDLSYDALLTPVDVQVDVAIESSTPNVAVQQWDGSAAPADCVAQVSYALTGGALPPGLVVSSTQGVISGTPAAAGFYTATLTRTAPWAPAASATVAFAVRDPAQDDYLGWNASTGGVFVPGRYISSLDLLAGDLVGLDPMATDGMRLVRSSDGGGTWAPDASVVAPAVHGDPGLASDGGAHLYLVGGADGDDAWVHDGSAWSQISAHVGTGPRRLPLVVSSGGDLYVIGGIDGSVRHDDAWRSSDGGRTWSPVADHVLETPFGQYGPALSCAADLAGRPVVVAWDLEVHPEWNGEVRVYSSEDRGLTWTRHLPADADSPLHGLGEPGRRQCVALGGRLYIVGRSGRVVSSDDLVHWRFEPSLGLVPMYAVEGIATIGGRLYIADETQSTAAAVVRGQGVPPTPGTAVYSTMP